MLSFRRKQPQLRALKLYSVYAPAREPVVSRAELVETSLDACQELFGSMPTKFSIDGSYGISKGQRIGLKAFLNKLECHGHDDYRGFHGEAPGKFGFNCRLGAKTASEHRYSEFVFWYQLAGSSIDVIALVTRLCAVFSSDYGYVIDMPSNYLASCEERIKRTLFGNLSLKQNRQLLHWYSGIGAVLQGKVRALYEYNFLNDAQAEALNPVGLPSMPMLGNGLRTLVFPDPASLKGAQTRYENEIREPLSA